MELDTNLLYTFIYEFNIARRHVSAYPSNHPMVTAKLSRVTGFLHQLLASRHDITLGIAKDTLRIGDSCLDKNNPVYRDVAKLFFSHGLAAVTFSPQLDNENLLNFYHTITLKREELDNRGGILGCLAELNVTGVQVVPIDYAAFQATDEDIITGETAIALEQQSTMIWDSFVSSLLNGTLGDGTAPALNSTITDSTLLLDPVVVSDILNNRAQHTSAREDTLVVYENSITEFLQKADERGSQKTELLSRLGSFINNLSPELRKQFLNSAFSSLANHQELAGTVLSKIPEKVILDALNDLSRKNTIIPPMILRLIGKLSSNVDEKLQSVVTTSRAVADDQIKGKIDVIFQEENPTQFVPENYLKALQSIIADESIAISDNLEIGDLRDSIAGHAIEEQVCNVILEMIHNPPDKENSDVLQRSIQELCDYFLSIGDFTELACIHDKMVHDSGLSTEKDSSTCLDFFSESAFIDEVLNGVNFWGKAKFVEISDLIDRIGEPFVGPILERLADEQNMSMRRFYMERLQKIGTPAKTAAIAKLRDNRWYFVRNLVLLLHKLGDATVVPHLRKLAAHPHLKVRHEVIKALLGFNDPEGDRILIRDMDSGDKETLLYAVRLAENSTNSEVHSRLLGHLSRSGLSGFEYELKSASIHSLGVIANPLSLPGLEQFLKSKTMLRTSQLNSLKLEVIQSLASYPSARVIPLLKTLAEKAHGEICQAAEESLRQLNGVERVN